MGLDSGGFTIPIKPTKSLGKCHAQMKIKPNHNYQISDEIATGNIIHQDQ